MSLEEKLEAMRRELIRLRLVIEQGPDGPWTMNLGAAARALSVSSKTIQRMIRSGQLRTVQIGGRSMVASSELRRLTSPAETRPTKQGAPKSGQSAKQEAQLYRERLKHRR